MSLLGDDNEKIELAPDRWAGIERDYAVADVQRLSGSIKFACKMAEPGAQRLWRLLHTRPFARTLGPSPSPVGESWIAAGKDSTDSAQSHRSQAGVTRPGMANSDSKKEFLDSPPRLRLPIQVPNRGFPPLCDLIA